MGSHEQEESHDQQAIVLQASGPAPFSCYRGGRSLRPDVTRGSSPAPRMGDMTVYLLRPARSCQGRSGGMGGGRRRVDLPSKQVKNNVYRKIRWEWMMPPSTGSGWLDPVREGGRGGGRHLVDVGGSGELTWRGVARRCRRRWGGQIQRPALTFFLRRGSCECT
jgi:hypothetical protein